MTKGFKGLIDPYEFVHKLRAVIEASSWGGAALKSNKNHKKHIHQERERDEVCIPGGKDQHF